MENNLLKMPLSPSESALPSSDGDANVRRVVVVGGGFGGVITAMLLSKATSWWWRTKVEVYVIDPKEYMAFKPMLYEVVSGCTTSTEVGPPYNVIFGSVSTCAFKDSSNNNNNNSSDEVVTSASGVRFIRALVTDINFDKRLVYCTPYPCSAPLVPASASTATSAHKTASASASKISDDFAYTPGIDGAIGLKQHKLHYDYLVLAIGTVPRPCPSTPPSTGHAPTPSAAGAAAQHSSTKKLPRNRAVNAARKLAWRPLTLQNMHDAHQLRACLLCYKHKYNAAGGTHGTPDQEPAPMDLEEEKEEKEGGDDDDEGEEKEEEEEVAMEPDEQEKGTTQKQQDRVLHVVILGGGFIGVELSLSVAACLHPIPACITLVHRGDQLLREVAPSSRLAAISELKRRDVKVVQCGSVLAVRRHTVILEATQPIEQQRDGSKESKGTFVLQADVVVNALGSVSCPVMSRLLFRLYGITGTSCNGSNSKTTSLNALTGDVNGSSAGELGHRQSHLLVSRTLQVLEPSMIPTTSEQELLSSAQSHTMQLAGRVFSLGDCAKVTSLLGTDGLASACASTGQQQQTTLPVWNILPVPTSAQAATQQAQLVSANLLLLLRFEHLPHAQRQKKLKNFTYVHLGEMVSIGPFRAAVSFLGGWVSFHGLFAGLVRRVVYAWKMPTWTQMFTALCSIFACMAAAGCNAVCCRS